MNFQNSEYFVLKARAWLDNSEISKDKGYCEAGPPEC